MSYQAEGGTIVPDMDANALWVHAPRNDIGSAYSALAFSPPLGGMARRDFDVWKGHLRGNAHRFIAERLLHHARGR
jgi:hypothetical protein